MATLISLFAFFVAFNSVTALDLSVEISPTLERRSINVEGGWASNTNAVNGTCPAETIFCFLGCCCPGELTCVATNDPVNCVCCPGSSSCETTFQQDPVCANSEWSLWNSTTQGQYGGFFCCEADQTGDTNGDCWPPGTEPAGTVRAMSLTPGTPGTQNTLHLKNKIRLSRDVIIGIVAGCAALVVLLALAVGCCCWKFCCKQRRNRKRDEYNQTYEPYRQR